MKRILTIIFTALILALAVNAKFERVNTYKGEFSDVSSGAWYEQDVKTAFELGFMNGKSENKFDPNGNASSLLPIEDERIWTVIEEMLTEMQEECNADDKSEEELKAELEDLINELSEMLPQHKGALEAILTAPDSVDYDGLRDSILKDVGDHFQEP